MNTNLCICRNEVFIEGENVGQFESFEYQADSKTLGNTATLTIPLYAIGVEQGGDARSRIRSVFKSNNVKPCAQVEVYMWYEGLERVKVFSGFIEHIGDGLPTKLYLQDNSFILRFGNIQKGWDGKATLQTIVKDCLPVAQKGFNEERKKRGFTREIPSLTYSVEKKNVQAVTTSLSFRNWGARSPHDTIQKLMQMLVLYGGVSDDYNVFVGAGVTKNTRPMIQLDTRYNVIERNIVPVDGRFVDYDVKITGVLANGRQYTATGGYGTSKSRQARSGFEKAYGESFRGFSNLSTTQGIQDFADRMLSSLKGVRNKGRITLLLYPKIEIMDWVQYNDTVFPNLSAGYYVLSYRLKADHNGFFQQLDVTDQIFAL